MTLRARWYLAAVLGLLSITAVPPAAAQDVSVASLVSGLLGSDSAGRSRLAALMRPGDYGIPRAPAFELLAEQPTEVTHLLTPHDFQAGLKSWYEGGKVKSGIAVDTRPFVRLGGSLADYQASAARRMAFRTILSAGTSLASTGSSNTVGAIGLRIPLVDAGDPRTDTSYLRTIATAYNAALLQLGPPPLGASDSVLNARAALAAKAIAGERERFQQANWNALRVELGIAGSATAASGAASPDSVTSTAGGLWLGGRIPLGPMAQLSVVAKGRWSRAVADSSETRRQMAGGRLLAFLGDRISLSAESAWIRADHARSPARDDGWWHLGTALEWYVPELKGWLGAGYGGDRQRSAGSKTQFALQYAFYSDRLISR